MTLNKYWEKVNQLHDSSQEKRPTLKLHSSLLDRLIRFKSPEARLRAVVVLTRAVLNINNIY